MDRLNSLFGALWGYVYTWLPTTARQWDDQIKLERRPTRRDINSSSLADSSAKKKRPLCKRESTDGPSSDMNYFLPVSKENLSLKSPTGKNLQIVRSSKQLAVIGSKCNCQRMRSKDRHSFRTWLRQRKRRDVFLSENDKPIKLHGRHEFCHHMNLAIQTKNADEKLEDGSTMRVLEGVRGKRKILRQRERRGKCVDDMTVIDGDNLPGGPCNQYGNRVLNSTTKHRENIDLQGSIIVIQVKPVNFEDHTR